LLESESLIQQAVIRLTFEKAERSMTMRTPRVLVVDDDSTHRKLMELISDHLGFIPEIVSDGARAIDAVSRSKFDVILLDWRMPEIDGEECTKRLRQLANCKTTPIIAVTAMALKGDREKCMEAGVDDYLAKPFTSDELKKLVLKWANLNVQTSSDTEPAEQDTLVTKTDT
jgi:CheY-like chemotaxis protein